MTMAATVTALRELATHYPGDSAIMMNVQKGQRALL